MVGTEGIAPSASCMSGRRSATELRPDVNGGRDGTRTHLFHRDREDSPLFVFTPHKLAPGAGAAATRECEMVGAERLARSRLPDSESGGSAVPREPRAEKLPFLAGLAPASDSP